MYNQVLNAEYQLAWNGPFMLQGSQSEVFLKSPATDESGIYLFTVEYCHGYLIYMAGWTTRPFKKRIQEHIRAYRRGTYTIFDTKSLQIGKRVELWHGMWMKKSTNTEEMKELFHSRRQELEPAIEDLLFAYRIVIAPLQTERRALARIEAAIMNILYSGSEPISTLQDRSMALALRWAEETLFLVCNLATVNLHGLPQFFEE